MFAISPLSYPLLSHTLLLVEGKAGSLVDEKGHFYKPVQVRAVCTYAC